MRSILAVASLMPATFFSSEIRAIVAAEMSTTVAAGTL